MKHPLDCFRLIVVSVLVLVMGACGQASEDAPAGAIPPAPTETLQAESAQHYEAVGVVVSFMASKRFINVDHEAIAGFMNAMTMPFEVKDSTLLREIQEGDSIRFTFTVANGIEAVEKID